MHFSTLLISALLSFSISSAAPIGDFQVSPTATATATTTTTTTVETAAAETADILSTTESVNNEQLLQSSYLVDTDNIQGSTRLSKREAVEKLAQTMGL